MSAHQRYNRSLFWLVLVNTLIKPIWILGIDRWVQNEVGPAVYGTYFSVWGLTLTLGFLLDLGLSTRIQREGADEAGSSDKLRGVFRAKLILLCIYFLGIALIGWFDSSVPTGLLWGVASIQAMQSSYVYLRAWVTAAQRFAADVWFSVLDKALLIPLCLLWLLGIWESVPDQISVFIGLQIATLLISIVIVVIFCFRQGIAIVDRSAFSFALLRRSWPYAGIVLLMSALTRLDGFWLLQWHSNGDVESGRYATGYRLLDAANMFGYLVASFLLPYLARQVSDRVLTRKAIDQARWGLLIFSVTAVLVVMVFPKTLVSILYPKETTDLSMLWSFLFGSILGYSLIHVYGTALTAWGELGLFQQVIGSAMLLHLLISACAIPSMGALGAAVAAWISQVLAGLVLMFLVHRRLGVSQPYASYLVVIFTSGAIWLFR